MSPDPVRDAALALVLGAVLGILLAFVRDKLDERVRSVSDLERAVRGVAILAVVSDTDQAKDAYFVAARDDSRSVAAESYRSLRTAVKFAGVERSIKIIQVTSPLVGDGKSTTVANLAVAFAQGGDRVAVVCCDLRRPRIQERFGESLTPGLTDALLGDASLQDALRDTSAGVYLLPSGSPPPNPSELLSSNRTAAVVEVLAEQFDVVLIDSTPVLPVTDALVISRLVDASIVVVNGQTTKRNALRRTIQMLDQVNAPILGLVLTGVEADGAYGYGYGYGHGGYGDDGGTGGRRSRRVRGGRRSAQRPASGTADDRRRQPIDGEFDLDAPGREAGRIAPAGANEEHPDAPEPSGGRGSGDGNGSGRVPDGPAGIRPGAGWPPGAS